MRKNIAWEQKVKRDEEELARRMDLNQPMLVDEGTGVADMKFRRPDQYLTSAVLTLNDLRNHVEIDVEDSITLRKDGQKIYIGGGGNILPDFIEWINTATHEGLAVYDDPPTNSSTVALVGKKDTKNSVYLENSQADFEPGELEGVEAVAAGLELITFNPLDIPGCHLWLDASQITGLSDGDPVSQWTDFSGNGYHATQATAAKRPTFKTGVQNGLPAIRFDGTDDWLRTASWGSKAQPNTVFIVAKPPANGTGTRIIIEGIVSTDRHLWAKDAANDSNSFYGGAWVSGATITGIANTWSIAALNFNGADFNVYINGESRVTGNIGAHGLSGLTIGTNLATDNFFFNSDMSEIIVYDTLLSDADRAKVEAYLSQKYGVSLTAGATPSGIPHGNRIALPQDLTPLPTDPGLEIRWTSTEPTGTDVGIETAVTGEALIGADDIGTGNETEDTNSSGLYSAGTFTYHGNDITTKKAIALKGVPVKIGANGSHTLYVREGHGKTGAILHTQTVDVSVGAGNWYTFVIDPPVKLDNNSSYHIGWDRPATLLYRLEGLYNGTLWDCNLSHYDSATIAYTADMGLLDIEDTFYSSFYPAERHSDLVVSVDGAATAEYTRPDVNDPRKIVFNSGHEPGNTLAVTADYTGVTEPSETAEVQTLYLGGATGGTYDLGIVGDMATLAYDDNDAAIQAALEDIFGAGLVTVADDPGAGDFIITFSVRIRDSDLTADFTSLTGATSPTLTKTTAYSAGDWEEQTSGVAITNIPAGDLTGQHLWIRQTLSTNDPAETPTLEEVEVHYGVLSYGVFTDGGTVHTL